VFFYEGRPMKRILTILAVGLLAGTQSANAQLEQTGMPPTTVIGVGSRDSDATDPEALAGKDIVIRLYSNWKTDPDAFEKAYVEFQGLGFKIADEQIDDSTVVVILGADQYEQALKERLGNTVHIWQYSSIKARQTSLGDYSNSGQGDSQLSLLDGLGNPLANAEVKLYLHNLSDKQPRISLGTFKLNDNGQLPLLQPRGHLSFMSFSVSHPDYGLAMIKGVHARAGEEIHIPLVRAGTEAFGRAIHGRVLDTLGSPVEGASIHCSNIRTLGEGLISETGGSVAVALTDNTGRFRYYMPNEDTRGHRGVLIPPKSRYHISIRAPGEDKLLPFFGEIVNDDEAIITLEPAGNFHSFVFEDENGPITDLDVLRQIRIYVSRPDKPHQGFEYKKFKDGCLVPAGTFSAQFTSMRTGETFDFEPVEVTDLSPQEIVFRVKSLIHYEGQVVHGLTGEPMAGAFVIAEEALASGNLSMLTAEQWDALHVLAFEFSVDDPALAPLHKMYGFSKIARTDADGCFAMSFRPGSRLYGFVAFEQDYLGVKRRKHALTPDEFNVARVPKLKLYPAATVVVKFSAEAKRLSISPYWLIDKANNPAWVTAFLQVDDRRESFFTYNRWLKLDIVQSFHVPAGLNLRLKLEAPYSPEWCPIKIEQPINLNQGESIDLGELTFQPALEIYARVVDSTGAAIEGVPVRVQRDKKAWSVAHNTDGEGLARFYVPPFTSGEFGVIYHGDGLSLQEVLPYEVTDHSDSGKQFLLRISDGLLARLFK